MREIKINENLYIHISNKKIYCLSYSFADEIKYLKTYKEVIEYLEENAFDFIEFESKESINKRKKIVKSFCLSMLSVALIVKLFSFSQSNIAPVLTENTHKKQMNKYVQELLLMEDENERENLFSKYLIEIIEAQDRDVTNEDICEIMFSKFSSKKEAFLFFMPQFINANPSLTKEEKESQIKEKTKQIGIYGDYYEDATIIDSLMGFATSNITREENLTYATHKKNGENSLIKYDPTWEKAEETLSHELSHAETANSVLPHVYKETVAAFLSNSGYSRNRALFTMLGKIGDSKEITKGLINGKPDLIWNSIKNRVNPSYYPEIDYLRALVETSKSFSKASIAYNITDEERKKERTNLNEVKEKIDELYFHIYDKEIEEDLLASLCSEIYYYSSKYEISNNLVDLDNFSIVLKIDEENKKEIFFNSDNNEKDLNQEWITFIKEYSAKSNHIITEDYYKNLNYWIATYIGLENYPYFLDGEVQNLFYSGTKTNHYIPKIYDFDLINLVELFQQGEYAEVWDLYIARWYGINHSALDRENFSLAYQGMYKLLPDYQKNDIVKYTKLMSSNSLDLIGKDMTKLNEEKTRTLTK